MDVGIVGLGLIGGSMAKAAKARTTHRVFGLDIDEETMLMARMSGSIDGELDGERLPSCSLVLLALRPQAAISWVVEHADALSGDTVVVDLCGVKRVVCDAIEPIATQHGFHYIGGHPMAGSENGGFINAEVDVFDGASMILTPDEHTDMEMLEMLKGFFLTIGFDRLTFTTPDEHDRIIAYTSQLCHVTSNAFVKSPTAQRHMGFSAGSFRDLTRVAKLDEDMWTELFLDNADYLAGELECLIDELKPYLVALRARDDETLRELLREGREKKATAGGR
jgi:prephenate dehydrogenase